MIAGIGIDMVEVDRIAEYINKENGFREKIFSANEIQYCEANQAKGQHYAARFAAKEAFLKATGLGLTLGYELAAIEVIHDSSGKPELKLGGKFLTYFEELRCIKIHLSITHVQSMACAIVILEQ